MNTILELKAAIDEMSAAIDELKKGHHAGSAKELAELKTKLEAALEEHQDRLEELESHAKSPGRTENRSARHASCASRKRGPACSRCSATASVVCC